MVRFLRMGIFIQMIRYYPKSWYQISNYQNCQVNQSNRFDSLFMKRTYVYCNSYTLLCKLNYGYHNWSHVFISIFRPVHFLAAKFSRCNEKNMRFKSSATKISGSLKKIWSTRTRLYDPQVFRFSDPFQILRWWSVQSTPLYVL